MPVDAPLVHIASRLCQASVAQAFDALASAAGMARWNLGLWHTRELQPGLFSGQSLFDGASGRVRVQADAERGLIDYAVGADAQALVPRIQAQVRDGALLGYAAGTCVVSLLAWRSVHLDDARWQRLMRTHELELDLIQAQLQAAAVGK